MILLLRPNVREELKIDAEQRQRLDAIRDEMNQTALANRPRFADRRTMTAEEQEQERQALQLRAEQRDQQIDQALDVLYDQQRSRLNELHLQQQGPVALFRSEIADALQLTHSQMDTLKALLAGPPMEPLVIPGNNPDPRRDIRAEMNKRIEVMKKQRERFNAEAPLILTDAQRAEWDKMQGRKFVFQSRTPAPPLIPPAPAKPE